MDFGGPGRTPTANNPAPTTPLGVKGGLAGMAVLGGARDFGARFLKNKVIILSRVGKLENRNEQRDTCHQPAQPGRGLGVGDSGGRGEGKAFSRDRGLCPLAEARTAEFQCLFNLLRFHSSVFIYPHSHTCPRLLQIK